MSRTEPLRGGFEQEALTGRRRSYCYLQKPGVAKKAKRQYNRRVRHKAKVEMWRDIMKDDIERYDDDDEEYTDDECPAVLRP